MQGQLRPDMARGLSVEILLPRGACPDMTGQSACCVTDISLGLSFTIIVEAAALPQCEQRFKVTAYFQLAPINSTAA